MENNPPLRKWDITIACLIFMNLGIVVMKKGSRYREIFPNEKFGMLKIIRFSHTFNRRSYYDVECECGKLCTVRRRYLIEYKFPNCGCASRMSSNTYTNTDQEALEFKMNCIKNLSHWKGECLIWDGYINGKTPRMSFKNISIAVRRWIYEYYYKNEIGNKMFVTAICGNYKCINIKHIGLTTNGNSYLRNKRIRKV